MTFLCDHSVLVDPREAALYVPELGGGRLQIPLEAAKKSDLDLKAAVEDPIEEVTATTLVKLARKKDHTLYMGVVNEAWLGTIEEKPSTT